MIPEWAKSLPKNPKDSADAEIGNQYLVTHRGRTMVMEYLGNGSYRVIHNGHTQADRTLDPWDTGGTLRGK